MVEGWGSSSEQEVGEGLGKEGLLESAYWFWYGRA